MTHLNDSSLRHATLHDVPALVELEAACFDYDLLKATHFRYFINSPQAHLLVVEQANELIAYALLLSRKHSSRARLYSIAVHPNFRGQGAAPLLWQALEDLCRLYGRHEMHFEVKQTNARAIHFYQKQGYEIIGEKKQYYDDGSDAYQMRKRFKT